ncbi:MAG: hypothetical protein HN927_03335 [Candidatus Marinimicrobia bacterium]|jgi:PBP1b-binding outer membrane lipoprotein LpoB|nr:hypothetical protein [Candidatus Neomarinimicrobiota bacterium]MBT4063654.1 hypothetical protein [Candidatus Neomarinimicrobiota bacterium]MBT4307313.1 hypothetical protein [Candidatus Neomarinimicrobiota bacterium]MBT4454202.1 hypothetical protein [Candidatus Neomarinimicrobiota bacterium]MBT4736024.1 hypothetical protein [Candidatus Neomarinimicrobiota bacterium]
MKKVIKPFAIILSNCLLMAQVKTVPNQVKVAYIGIQVENVESWVKSELETKLNAIFNGLDPEKLIKSDEVNKLAKEEIETLFIEINDQNFQKIADKTGARYIFAGKFKNVSPDKSRIMIQGDFYRYNAQLKSSFRYEVLKYYERMNDEVKVIQQQMVDSMPYAPKPASLKQVTFVFTGIILIGLVFMTLTGTSVWQNGEGSGEGTKPTEN